MHCTLEPPRWQLIHGVPYHSQYQSQHLLTSCSQDGSERKVVVSSKIVYPYGVAVDHPNRHIFWVDTYLDYIERADFDGGDRRTVLRGAPVQNLYSVTVFQNDVFVSSWRDNSVLRVDKFNRDPIRPIRKCL